METTSSATLFDRFSSSATFRPPRQAHAPYLEIAPPTHDFENIPGIRSAMDLLLCDIFDSDYADSSFIASTAAHDKFDLFHDEEPRVQLPEEHSLLFPTQQDSTQFCRFQLPSLEQEPDADQPEVATRKMVCKNVEVLQNRQSSGGNNANSATTMNRRHELQDDSADVAPYCANIEVVCKNIASRSEEVEGGRGVKNPRGYGGKTDNLEQYSVCADQEPSKKRKVEVGTGGGQRMAHIAVERNRRKQMNEHLAILRSLMPGSYVHRGDQASVIGAVVEFVKELEQLVVSLEAQKLRRKKSSFSDALTAPPRDAVATSRSAQADVEVRLAAGGAHVELRTLSPKTRGRRQLLQLAALLEGLSLQILQVNITTVDDTVLYAFTLKIGIDCQLSLEDLAVAAQQIFSQIPGDHVHLASQIPHEAFVKDAWS